MNRTRTAIAAALVIAVGLLTGCLPQPAPVTYVIGDSNTIDQSWATKLGSTCAPARWAWGGVGVFWGEPTFATGLNLNDDHKLMLNGHQGAHVVVMLGTNDLTYTTKVATTAELNAISQKLIGDGAASVRWIPVPPFADTVNPAIRARRTAWNQSVAGTDWAVPLDQNAVLGDPLPAAMRVDSKHLSPAGHRKLGAAVSPLIC